MMSIKNYIFAAAIAVFFDGNGVLANENATVDPMKSAAWPNIQKNLFGDRQFPLGHALLTDSLLTKRVSAAPLC